MNLVRADRIHCGVSLNLVRDLGMARLSGKWGLAPPGGAGYGTNIALLSAIRNRVAAAGQITECDCRACFSAPDPPICSGVPAHW